MSFRVDLDTFRGPLDLLLYLVRKHEVDILDIPIALMTEQYLKYLAVLEQLDVGAVGDFLAVASMLIEIKSQQVLPRGDEIEDEIDDPRRELVQRLLEYKKFRDVASILEERARSWQQRFARLAQRPAAARARPGGRADPRGGVVGPGQRVRADHARHGGRQAVEHRLRRHADPRLHGEDLRPGPPAGPSGVQRTVPGRHAQVDPGGHLPCRPGIGPPPLPQRRAELAVRRNLAPSAARERRAPGLVERGQLRSCWCEPDPRCHA